jgi:hypothetical protein
MDALSDAWLDFGFQIGPRIARKALTAAFTKCPVGEKLVSHWLSGEGTPMTLTIHDMAEIGGGIDD